MANMLQSSQTQATQAPSFYTDYLSGIAATGQEAQKAAQFVGAQPLQTKAFERVGENVGTGQGAVQQGQGYLGQAAGQDITGAVTPYLQAATTASPLCAARPIICESRGLDIGALAGSYMSPYARNAVQALSDIGQRNIRQNLSPAATAAAVGSGQFGSQRGAQVLGQVQSQAQQDLNAQIAQMLNTGFGQSLQAAQAKQTALGNLAQTTAGAQQAQNQANIQAAQAAGCSAYRQAAALKEAGLGLGTLGEQASRLNLACVNALATLGGQQQTIAQNQQLFPLTTLSSLASLLQGYSIPTATKTTLCMSPFSAAGALGAAGLGMVQPRVDASGKPIAGSSQLDILKGIFKNAFPSTPDTSIPGYTGTPADVENAYSNLPEDFGSYFFADGGQVGGDSMGRGAIPMGYCASACVTCTPYAARGGLIGVTGCASTQTRGALPYKG